MVTTLVALTITTFCSLVAFYEIGLNSGVKHITLASWIESLDVNWGFLFDSLTVVMLVVVSFVSTLVHLYSTSYMGEDPHLPRFLSYLSLFTFFMVVLVTADNLLLMFVGWEGVGIASYLLITFWTTRLQANKSAIKALLVNRVGDFALAIALFLIFLEFRTLDYSTLFPAVELGSEAPEALELSGGLKEGGTLRAPLRYTLSQDMIPIFLFIGAMGKSAQLGLHTWLADAMEGPTPVSALIHAATMVTAGVFLVSRCSPLFESSSIALSVLVCVGGLTALFGGVLGGYQNDIKRVIAYSTCSQLGYMFFACGLSHYNVAIFHLFTHAFFKALLFLGAGSLIHGLNDEQDIRRMGGNTQVFPMTYVSILIGSLALMGIPGLAGYYSKESILEIAFIRYGVLAHGVFWLGSLAAFLTAFYSFRILTLGFYRLPQSVPRVFAQAHESDHGALLFPLFVLAIGSIGIGSLTRDLFLGFGTDFWGNAIELGPVLLSDSEFYQSIFTKTPLVFTFCGALFAVLFAASRGTPFSSPLSSRPAPGMIGPVLASIGANRWFFDKIMNDFFARVGTRFAYHVPFRNLDKGVFERPIGPYGIYQGFPKISRRLVSLQSGLIYHYAFIILLSLTFAISFHHFTTALFPVFPISKTLFIFAFLLYFLEAAPDFRSDQR